MANVGGIDITCISIEERIEFSLNLNLILEPGN